MYLSHFGLTESPFGITPNPAFFYSGNTRGEILQALLYVVTHGEGIIKVTGEVGSGKTMLCRMLERQLPPHIEVIYLVNPSLSPMEALYAIASELGLQPDGKRADEVLRELHADLISKHSGRRQVVLLVEEAQAMPLATLEEIRLLTNLETAHHKLLQIVLFGQPELDQHLDLASMRQLKERITHSFEVPAMPAELIPEFLACRLRAAGYQGPPLFSAEAVRRIALVSQGIVRRINILADKAMLAAYADDAASVAARHVQDAVRDSAFRPAMNRTNRTNRASIALVGLIVALLLAIAWLLLRPQPSTANVEAAWHAGAVAAAVPVPMPATMSSSTAAPAAAATSATSAPPAATVSSAAATPAVAAPPASAPAASNSPSGAPAITTDAAAAAVLRAQAAAAKQPAPAAAPTTLTTLANAALPAASAAVAPAAAAPIIVPRAPVLQPLTLLQQSLRATRSWLRDEPDSNLSLLIVTVPASEREQLEQFLSSTREAIGLEQVHAYPLRQAGADCIAIVYGSYATRKQAEEVQARLAGHWAYKPQIRTVRAIRNEAAKGGVAW